MQQKRHLRSNTRRSEKGQSIVLIAAAFIGLLAFAGLALDAGGLFIQYGHLRRAVDSASIAAANQYRENYAITELTKTATEFIRLNAITGTTVVEICDDAHAGDLSLCTTPRRKLVRVTATTHVDFFFLPIVGLNGTDISASAIGEAASMDVVLVIDLSESMTWDAACGDGTGDDDDEDGDSDDGPATNDPFNPWRNCNGNARGTPEYAMRDPYECNKADEDGSEDGIPGECHPFEEVKAAAAEFAAFVLDRPVDEEEDRLGIVVFSNGWEEAPKGTYVVPTITWHNDGNAARAEILNLKVYEAPECPSDWVHSSTPGTCRLYQTDPTFGKIFAGTVCPFAQAGNPFTITGVGDVSTCATTNIGMGLSYAGNMFSIDTNPSSLWVTVLITDGAANASELTQPQVDYLQSEYNPSNPSEHPINAILPFGFCPEPTNMNYPYCQDGSTNSHHGSASDDYDADDYARDRARFVACAAVNPPGGCNGIEGQGSIVFAIGYGQEVLKGSPVPYGDSLLRFVAALGDDGNPNSVNEPCASVPVPGQTSGNDSYRCGNYYFIEKIETGHELSDAFDDIASRIFTRLSE